MSGTRTLAEIPHLAVTAVVMHYDIGDEIARRHGEPMVTTACGKEIVSTLTTRREDLVRCERCRRARYDAGIGPAGEQLHQLGARAG